MIGMLIDKLYFLAGAHHVDLRFATGEDPKWLQDVRKGGASIIAEWLCHSN
jgi:lysosomal Pro-X carboxypeptidase